MLRISLGLSSETMWDPLRLYKGLFGTSFGVFRKTISDLLRAIYEDSLEFVKDYLKIGIY